MDRFPSFIRRHWVPLLALCTLALFLSIIDHVFFFHGGDNADYISLARSLVEGRGYTDINTFPAAPHVKYPFVFPAMIALCMAAFGENILALKAMIALCAAVAAGAAGLLWRDRERTYLAPLAAMLMAAAPALFYYSVDIYSEIPYTMFSLLALVFTERAIKREAAGRAAPALASVFVLLAAFTRSIGLSLGPALVLAALVQPPARAGLRRRAARALLMVFPLAIMTALWIVRAHVLVRGAGRGYLAEFLLKDPYSSASATITASDLLARIIGNCGYYLHELGIELWPFAAAPPSRGMAAAGAVIGGVLLLGLVRAGRKRVGAPEFYLVLYTGAMLSWSFRERRMLLPLLPLMFYYLLLGLEMIARAPGVMLPGRGAWAAKAAVCLLAAAVMALQLLTDGVLVRRWREMRTGPAFMVNPEFRVEAIDAGLGRVLTASAYLHDHAEAGAVIFARKPSLVALVSAHPAAGGPFAADPAGFVRELEEHRVRYVVADEVFPETAKAIMAAIRAYPDRFALLYRVGDSHTAVYEFRPR